MATGASNNLVIHLMPLAFTASLAEPWPVERSETGTGNEGGEIRRKRRLRDPWHHADQYIDAGALSPRTHPDATEVMR